MAGAATMAEARRRLGSDAAGAARLARRLLAATPGSVEAMFVLAAALRRSGAVAEALSLLASLGRTAPGAWGVHYEHGLALALSGDSEAAEPALARAVALNPQSSLALHAWGDQLAVLGEKDRAETAQSRVVRGGRDDPRLREGVAAMFDGDRPRAEAILGGELGLHTNDIAALRLIADAGLRLGADAAVADLMAGVAAGAPAFLPVHYCLAVALHRLEQAEAGLAVTRGLIAARPGNADYRAIDGALSMQIGDAAAAVDAFGRATAIRPGDAALNVALGHARRAAGHPGDAAAAYRTATGLRPGFGEAWWSIANLKTQAFSDAEHDRMAHLLHGALPDHDRSYLDFAFARSLEQRGDDAAAFRHYRRGNAARRAAEPYDADAASALVDRIIDSCPAEVFAARRGWGDPSDRPVFIVGMPRSGSTLVEQMLCSHSQVEGASELPHIGSLARRVAAGGSYPDGLAALPAPAFAALGAEYLAGTDIYRCLGRPRLVDKHPGNVLHAGLIHLMLPGAAIIDVRRDPLDCCVSLFRQAFAAGQGYAYDLGDLGRAYRDYVRLTRHFGRVLPGRILRLDYAALLDDPEAQLRRLLDHLGLAFEPGCLRFFETERVVRTPSSAQVRRPLNRDGVGVWRRFAPWLDPLREALGPLVSG